MITFWFEKRPWDWTWSRFLDEEIIHECDREFVSGQTRRVQGAFSFIVTSNRSESPRFTHAHAFMNDTERIFHSSSPGTQQQLERMLEWWMYSDELESLNLLTIQVQLCMVEMVLYVFDFQGMWHAYGCEPFYISYRVVVESLLRCLVSLIFILKQVCLS